MSTFRNLVFAIGLSLVFILPLSAEPSGKLYAYANPLSGPLKFADHTWVTDYDVRPSCPKPNANYWYSTGDCHPDASDNSPRPLSSADANLDMAKCIAAPNESTFDPGPATANILYGIDGVCHQIANRILAATGRDEQTPISVAGAKGYKISRFVYGEYGTASQWAGLKNKCAVSAMSIRDAQADITDMATQANLLDRLPVLQAEQNDLRRQITEIGRLSSIGEVTPSAVAERLNGVINASLNRLARALGEKNFQRLFDWPAEQEIMLVNPDIAAKVRYVNRGGVS